MKKILVILGNIFLIIPSFTSVSCSQKMLEDQLNFKKEKEDYMKDALKKIFQKQIDKIIEQLKNQIINITVTNGTIETIKEAIKSSSDLKTKLDDANISIESFEFKKDDNNFQRIFQNNTEYEVIVSLKKSEEILLEYLIYMIKYYQKFLITVSGEAKFKIKVTFS